MKIKFGFVIILFTCCAAAFGQVVIHETWETNKKNRIALTDVIGDWYASDSLKSKITFVKLLNKDVIIEGKRDGVNDYRFARDEDSIHVNGIAANWPPYYCTLFLYDNNTLEIKFYQFHSREATVITYKRN